MANNIAYGISAPLLPVFPAPQISNRAPTIEDKLTVGQWWIDEVGNQAYILTSIINNQANWSTLTIMGVGVFNAVEATTGNITADLGNITATVGNISAGGTITSGASLTVITGDLGVLVGDINVNLGNIILTTGNLRLTAGDIDTIAGDINSAAAITAGTTITAAGNITSSAGNIIATAGNIVATAGSITAGTTISAGTGINTTAGGITATAGNITATAGNIVTTVGDINSGNDIHVANQIFSVGNIQTTTGFISADTGDVLVGGNVFLPSSDPLGGQICINGAYFLHSANFVLNYNTCVGLLAGNQTSIATWNTIVGALSMNTMTDTDSGNVAIGYNSMPVVNGGCVFNTACGTQSLEALTGGVRNSCLGRGTLNGLLTGGFNIALGYGAGSDYVAAESSNICLGHVGVVGENNTIHIGTDGNAPGQQDTCYIAGDVTIARGITATTGDITTSTAGKGIVVGGGAKVVSGAGDPNGVVTAPQGSLYLNLTGSAVNDRAWINTNGITAWTNLVTAA